MIDIYIKLEGIDDWYRPIFKDINSKDRYCDTRCTKTGKPIDVTNFYKENIHLLEYAGTSFGCEPNGGLSENINLIIVDL